MLNWLDMVPFLLFLVLLNSEGACGAITRAQVEAATGLGFATGVEEYSKTGSTCSYESGPAVVTISTQQLEAELDLKAELRNLTEAIPGSTIREVKGIAERAYAMEIPGAGTQLHVLPAARVYVLISVLGVGDAGRSFDAALRLGRDVSRSLKK